MHSSGHGPPVQITCMISRLSFSATLCHACVMLCVHERHSEDGTGGNQRGQKCSYSYTWEGEERWECRRGCDNFTATTFHSAEASCRLLQDDDGAAPHPHLSQPGRHRPSSLSLSLLPSFQCAISPVLSLLRLYFHWPKNTHTPARARLGPGRLTGPVAKN